VSKRKGHQEDLVQMRKATACLATVAGLAGLAGCANNAVRKESTAFPFAGSKLTIDTSEAILRVENGPGRDIVVDRTLNGNAARTGNAPLSMDGTTLKLGVICSGVVINCSADYVVQVPRGVAVELTGSGSPVEFDGLTGDLTAALHADGTLTVVHPAGDLQLECAGGDIHVIGARSAVVTATASDDGNVIMSFAAPPSMVDARSTTGSVKVMLPSGTESYRIDAPGSSALPSDPRSTRVITAISGAGDAIVEKG
jgi:hypothetical protein